MLIVRACVLSLTLALLGTSSAAQQPPEDLTTKSIEDLMSIEVTSVSKKEEKLFQSAAAIYVITQEEIRRSGMTTIPDLLRRVPGLAVARIDGTKWAVSARGFNGRFTNKLLVMIDGRSVYTPDYSGVYWESQDVLLEDVERIEVIRGPGGTLWGANAVNGVINIITKDSRDTQGGLVTAGAGTDDRGFGSVRYGGKLNDKADYKVYGKYLNRRGMVDAAGNYSKDGLRALRGGARVDWAITDRDSLTLQGEIFQANLREPSGAISPDPPFTPVTNPVTGLNSHILGRWTRTMSKESESALQVYYDRTTTDLGVFRSSISTLDVDFQHRLPLGRRQDFVWGLGYRMIADEYQISSASPLQINPKQQTIHLLSAFAQDELTLIEDRLRLTLGTKVEHNDYTGFEVQPSARLLWTPSNRQTIWAAVSRAVRTPSRGERDVRVNAPLLALGPGPKVMFALFGDRNTSSEDLLAFELGYRARPARKLTVDIATFYNSYDGLIARGAFPAFLEAEPNQPPYLVIPRRFANLLHGETYGVETSVDWRPTHFWRLKGGYSFFKMQLHRGPSGVGDEMGEGRDPESQFQFHSNLTLPRNFELDTSLYYVASLPTDRIPAYTRIDARLGWNVRENVELSLGVRNLLDQRHLEFWGDGTAALNRQTKRDVYGKFIWRF